MKNCISVVPTASVAELGALPGPATDTTDSATLPSIATISGIVNIILKFSGSNPPLELHRIHRGGVGSNKPVLGPSAVPRLAWCRAPRPTDSSPHGQ